jgi:hypothetical protein
VEACDESPIGRERRGTKQQWLGYVRSLPEFDDMLEIDLILECCGVHRCNAAKRLGEELHICHHFDPPDLTVLLQQSAGG